MPSSGQATIDIGAFLDSRPVSNTQILVAALCGLVVLLDGLDTEVASYLVPALSEEWKLSTAALGPVLSAGAGGIMAGLLLLAPVGDRIGRKYTILISATLFGLFSILTVTAPNVTALMAYRFLAGIGLGAALPNALALTGEYTPKRMRATIVVAMFCGFSLGTILGGSLMAGLIGQFGWRAIFLIGGVLPLALVPILWKLLPESPPFLVATGGRKSQIASLLHRVDHRFLPSPDVRFVSSEGKAAGVPVLRLFQDGRAVGTVLLWLIFFCNLLGFYVLQNSLPTLFADSGLPMARAALVASLIPAGGIAVGVLSGFSMDRFGPYPVLTGLYLAGTVFMAAIGFSTPLLLAPIAFLAGFCVSGGRNSVNALAVMFYPAPMRSTGAGWALGFGALGFIAGPILTSSLISQGLMARHLFELAALPMLVAAVLTFLLGRTAAR